MRIKYLLICVILMSLILCGCKSEPADSGSPVATVEPTATPVPTTAPEPTATPVVTPEPVDEGNSQGDGNDAEQEPEASQLEASNTVVEDKNISYEDFLGTWYMHSYSFYEEMYDCYEDGIDKSITFYTGYRAELVYKSIYDSDIYEYSGNCRFFIENDTAYVTAELNDNCLHSFSIDENGNLVDELTIIYDEYDREYALHIYTREEYDWSGLIPVTPSFALEYMENAEENEWLTVLHDCGAEVYMECEECGWTVHNEETFSEYWENAKELIIINNRDCAVNIEIHEPASTYDPKQDDNYWEAGPFMYYARLEQGELYRVVVDMPAESRDATLAMYIEFDGDDATYYLRIYDYDMAEPYVGF